MNGSLNIGKCNHGTGWELSVSNDAGDFCSYTIDAKAVGEIIRQLNETAIAGAPWEVFGELTN